MISGRASVKALAVLLSLSAALLLLMACTPSHPQSTFDASGPVAEKQLTLLYIMLVPALLVFVAVAGVLVFAVVRYRRKPGDQIPAQIHGNTPLEIGWTIAPAIMLIVIAVPTLIYIFEISDTPPAGALEVNVTGHQWWWEFEYPEQNVLTANELHVPVDRPVLLNLRSDDVIHSFWIPKLAGKVDVIPSNLNKMWFEARRVDIDSLPAVFFGQCAEFCGEAHANMRFRIIVEEEYAFNDWVEKYHEIVARGSPTEGDALEGAQLFASKGCTLCHVANGPIRIDLMPVFFGGGAAFPGPNLSNLGTRNTLAAGFVDDLNRDTLTEWLTDPEKVKPGNRMAQLANVYTTDIEEEKLTEDDIDKLASYLLSLR